MGSDARGERRSAQFVISSQQQHPRTAISSFFLRVMTPAAPPRPRPRAPPLPLPRVPPRLDGRGCANECSESIVMLECGCSGDPGGEGDAEGEDGIMAGDGG